MISVGKNTVLLIISLILHGRLLQIFINMNDILEILKYTIPALIVFLTTAIMIRGFFRNEEQRRSMHETDLNREKTLPIRMQAYERMALFLERISPESLIMRVNKPDMTAAQLQSELLSTIRSEYEHNVAQQVYISSETWELIKTAKNNIISLVNSAADQLKDDATSLTLSQKIFEQLIQLKSVPTTQALESLKKEMERLF